MPANYSSVGSLMATNPKVARQTLAELFKTHTYDAAVAASVGVDPTTVRRWVGRLIAMGFKTPRVLRHGQRGPDKKPRAKKVIAKRPRASRKAMVKS